MAVKYQCPKCERRFVDWGAEKLGFKCPECADTELVRLGGVDDMPKAAPPLKRKSKVVAQEADEVLVGVEDKEDDAVDIALGDDDLDDLDATADGDVAIDDEPLD